MNDYEMKIALIKNTVKQYQNLLEAALNDQDYGKAAYQKGYIEGLECALLYLGEGGEADTVYGCICGQGEDADVWAHARHCPYYAPF